MYKGKKILGLIPARGGSKGVPRKNVLEVNGRPLIAWTIDEAKKSKYIDRLILSSEDAEIIETAKRFGCEAPFVRPAELSRDETPGIDPVLHAVGAVEGFDYLVLLQPTSPLRIAGDIDGCIERCIDGGFDSCVSVKEVGDHPYLMFKLLGGAALEKLHKEKADRRQDLPDFYVLNGAVYVIHIGALLDVKDFITPNTAGYVMPEDRSLDIDTPHDIELLKLYAANSIRTK